MSDPVDPKSPEEVPKSITIEGVTYPIASIKAGWKPPKFQLADIDWAKVGEFPDLAKLDGIMAAAAEKIVQALSVPPQVLGTPPPGLFAGSVTNAAPSALPPVTLDSLKSMCEQVAKKHESAWSKLADLVLGGGWPPEPIVIEPEPPEPLGFCGPCNLGLSVFAGPPLFAIDCGDCGPTTFLPVDAGSPGEGAGADRQEAAPWCQDLPHRRVIRPHRLRGWIDPEQG